ncbi:MAG: hypothetical protein IBJ10_04865, partial [Phycisphaerales bacterium]|nr:hypothetical protein [Phycisphaerales bacterium]
VPSVPAGDLTVRFSYIANQPAVNSRSSDTYGAATFGGINWNNVLVYPAHADRASLMIAPSLRFPSDWKDASGLEFNQRRQGLPGFRLYAPVTLAELVDSPVIIGQHLRTHPMQPRAGAPHFLHAVGATPAQVELPEARLKKFEEMHRQSELIFGPFPYSRYHYLILLDDSLPGFGLEHATSTYISMRGDRFQKAETGDGDPMSVVPHEYIHAWCGKLVAPAGLLHPNYHTPGRTELLWVYEGLVSYYDEVLCARSGLMSPDEFRHSLTGSIAGYELNAGRRWRSVEDTALAMRFLRAPSDSWEDLRRRQDYYGEGALFWATADAVIRAGTDGARSLDDFALAFFRPNSPAGEAPGVPIRTYTREDVVNALSAVYAGHDWDALIRDMIESPQDEPAFELPARLGYKLEWLPEPTELQKKDERADRGANLRSSIGLRTDADGKIISIVPGSPADRAKLGYAQRILAVGRDASADAPAPPNAPPAPFARLFSPGALRDAVKASLTVGAVDLLIAEGDLIRQVRIEYAGGLRYPRLVRVEGSPDLLAAIEAPR